jgi:GDP-4-dehydro-6-deoxy-D-mannose reductase
MTRRALITGAGGFVGTVLHSYLAGLGWDTRCSDVQTPPGAENWFPCDVSDPVQVDRMIAWTGPVTHVFHLAAITFVPESGRDPSRTFAVNLQGAVHLAVALHKHAPDARLIFVGSAEVYGHPQFLPITEEHPIHPTNPYAISKAAADHYCAYAHCAEGLDVIRMRPFNHSGPGQADTFVLSSFAHQIAQIETGRLAPVLRVGNLETSRDFSHVNDVVRAYERAAIEGRSGEAYNVCSGRAVSIREALNKLLDLSGVAIRIEPDPDRMRVVDVIEARGSHEKLTAHTGWRPEISLDHLLADLLQYWRAREGVSG